MISMSRAPVLAALVLRAEAKGVPDTVVGLVFDAALGGIAAR